MDIFKHTVFVFELYEPCGPQRKSEGQNRAKEVEMMTMKEISRQGRKLELKNWLQGGEKEYLYVKLKEKNPKFGPNVDLLGKMSGSYMSTNGKILAFNVSSSFKT